MFDVIGFDADDTLWHNESIFTMTQGKFQKMFSSHCPEKVNNALSSTQIKNLEIFGLFFWLVFGQHILVFQLKQPLKSWTLSRT